MATNAERDEPPLDIREQIARIDKMLAEKDRTRQEISIAPFALVFTGVGAGAAIFAAGAAFAKLLVN